MTDTAQTFTGWRRVVGLAILGATAAAVLWIVGALLWDEFGPGAAQSNAWVECITSFSAAQDMELKDSGTSSTALCDQEQAEDPEAFLQQYGD